MEQDKKQKVGRVIAVQGPVVDVKFDSADCIPDILENINTETIDGKKVILEVAEHLAGNIARCISINSTFNIQRSALAYPQDELIQVPVGDGLFGRIVNDWGMPIDQKGDIPYLEKMPIRLRRSGMGSVSVGQEKPEKYEILET